MSSDSLFEKNPKIFCAATFLLELLGGEEADYRKSSRNCGHIFTCASLHKRPICTQASTEKKEFSFAPIISAVSFLSTTAKKQCRFSISLMYRDNIQCPSHHFNLLLLQCSCCGALLYYQAKKNAGRYKQTCLT